MFRLTKVFGTIALTASRQQRNAETAFMSIIVLKSESAVASIRDIANPPAQWIEPQSGGRLA